MEITISEPVAERIVDSCVGIDNRRYYKVQWNTTWEPEEELTNKYQNLIEDFWKQSTGTGDIESGKNFLTDLFEKLSETPDQSQNTKDAKETVSASAEAVVDYNIESFYKEVNSPEHKISSEPPPPLVDNIEKPPPLTNTAGGSNELRPFNCDECTRAYPTEKKLKEHKRKLHTNIGTYQCSVCSKLFTTKRNLQQHMNRHTGVGPHVCPGCSKRYMTSQEVETHKRSCNNLVEKEFQCGVCSKRFATKTHLSFHTKIHLPDDEKPFKCQYCPRTFAYNHDCVHHMRLHIGEKPFKCSQCEAAFHRKSYLTEHMFVHTGISKYRCEECMEYFKTQQILQTHVKNVHILGKKNISEDENHEKKGTRRMKRKAVQYKCEECDKEFRFLKEFHYHQVMNHKEALQRKKTESLEYTEFEPTMVYKCKKCEKTFNWPSTLKKHSKTHRDIEVDRRKPVKGSGGKGKLTTDALDDVSKTKTLDHKPKETAKLRINIEEPPISLGTIEQVESENVTYPQLESETSLEVPKTVELNFACNTCLTTFNNEINLNIHVLEKHHSQALVALTTAEKQFIEDVAQRSSNTVQEAILQNNHDSLQNNSNTMVGESKVIDNVPASALDQPLSQLLQIENQEQYIL